MVWTRRCGLLRSRHSWRPGPVDADVNGLRLGTPELVRLGMVEADMPELAGLIAARLDDRVDPLGVAAEVSAWRKRFSGIHFTAQRPR